MASENKVNPAPQSLKPKKEENKTVLSRIRSRVGLLVGIVFLALAAFILTDLINRGGMTGPSNADVGEINGNTVSIREFQTMVDQYTGDRQLSEQQQEQMREGVWQELIFKYVYDPEYNELGLSLTDDELAEQMMGSHPSPYMNQYFQDQQTGMISPEFSGPDGSLSGQKIREFVSTRMTPEQEPQWISIENEMRKALLREKYNQLLRKGIYITTAQAKREYADENTKYNFKFIVKRYSDVADTTIAVTDAELQDYYNANTYKFKQRESQRTIEYVTFDIFPSADDIADQRNEMGSLVDKFKASKNTKEDSIFVLANSDDGMYMKQNLRAGTFPVGADSAFLKAAVGDVLGPFNQGDQISIYKVTNHSTSADSAKVRHILFAYKGGASAAPDVTRTKEQAKAKADSLQKAIKKGAKMEDLVEKFTDDPGSKSGNKGDYGWFTHESGFVEPFKNAGFNNKKGDVVVVETDFGYHVIQVLDQTAPSRKVEVVAVNRKVVASESTIRSIYNSAAQFAGTNNNAELFDAAVKKDNMNLLTAGEIQENSKYINGIENAREIVRWMYDEETTTGSVSQPFQSGERYIVAKLSKVLEKGIKPLDNEDVRKMCEAEVRRQKKAAMFTEELNKTKGATLDVWAANSKLTVQPAVNVTFAAPYVQGAGAEGDVVAVLSTLKPGTIPSAPIKGTMGVYVVVLESVTPAEPLVDVKGQQTRLIQGAAARVDGAAGDVLKENANIIDNRAKHF